MGVGGYRHAATALSPTRGPVPAEQTVGLAPGPVWPGAENSPLLRFDPRTPQSVAQSL